jgi:hypothetical protein
MMPLFTQEERHGGDGNAECGNALWLCGSSSPESQDSLRCPCREWFMAALALIAGVLILVGH